MEEKEELEPTYLDDIKVGEWIKEANYDLNKYVGFTLPVIVGKPKENFKTTIWETHGIEMPIGALFYPCCGRDLSHPIANFSKVANSLHFADTNISQKACMGQRPKLETVKHIGSIMIMAPTVSEEKKDGCTVNMHQADGLVALAKQVPDLSVFYYRNDSRGEGGSNQMWLEPVLFHYILERLMNGGLIVTDGSNGGYWDAGPIFDIEAPWNVMCPQLPCFDSKVTYFEYAQRKFQFICELEDASGPVKVWQVSV